MIKPLISILLITILSLTTAYAAPNKQGQVVIEKFVYQSIVEPNLNQPTIDWLQDKASGALMVLKYEDSIRSMLISKEDLEAAANGAIPLSVKSKIKIMLDAGDEGPTQ